MLSKDQEIHIEQKAVLAAPSLWSQLGPVLLLGSFAVLLLKSAPLYWPLALTAFTGFATTLYLKKRGLYLSLFILAAVLILLTRTGIAPFWPLMLTASIGLSWLLIFLGNEEMASFQRQREEKISSIEEHSRALDKQLREAKVAISKENKDLIAEKERLSAQLNTVTVQLNQTHAVLQTTNKEKEKLVAKCEALSQDIFAAQRKEISFQHALEDAQTQLLKLKGQLAVFEQSKETQEVPSNIVPMEEIDPQEKIRLEQVQHQYTNLREQFEEKSEALDRARKELFKTENELLTLQKAWEEKANEVSEEDLSLIRDLKRMEEEILELETQVSALQEFITALLSPKKRSSRSKKSADNLEDEQGLPLLIQEKINQRTAPNTRLSTN